ncbi:MAG: hypothetical protein WCH46_04285 [bacterium]
MKYVFFILATLLCANSSFAQPPTISYMMCDEAKSQLQIHGSFGSDSGSVSIEDTTLGIVAWSDSLIICSLPDSGRGAGGHVVVENGSGKSDVRVLSIFQLFLLRVIEATYQDWIVSWRLDIKHFINKVNERFTNSRISFGISEDFRVRQSYKLGDSALIGKVENSMLLFDKIRMNGRGFTTTYQIHSIQFDSTALIKGYSDVDSSEFPYIASDSILVQILFPPNPQNIVIQKSKPHDPIEIWEEAHSLIIHPAESLNSTTASLYSIDGRLLKRENLNISAEEHYSIDVSDVHARFALLVLQSAKGVITRKILF